MKSLIDLKNELLNKRVSNLYVLAGVENLIRKIYYEKIASIYNGNLKHIESVDILFKELEKKPLFAVRTAYVVYNDMDFLKQKEKTYQRLIKLSQKNVVILVYDEIPEKGLFRDMLEEYITIFNKVTDDVAIKYVVRESKNNNLNLEFAKKIAFNCDNSYNNIVEEMNKYQWLHTDNDHKSDDVLDALRYAQIFYDKKIPPTPREFANAFIQRSAFLLNAYLDIVSTQNILGYLPELYNTISLTLYLKMYGKWDGGSRAYNAGEYWGRVKELRDLYIPYTKDDLLDIRYLVNQLDLDIRSGKMKPEFAWDYLIGVIL